jgi:site-specific recombinase XerD
MTQALTTIDERGLIISHALPADRQPAAVYLARLAPGSRRTMGDALNTIAAMLSAGKVDAFGLDWGALRFQHTAAIRSKLAERYSAATANKMLSALRGVLHAAFRLEQIGAEDYERAKDIEHVEGNSLQAGRALGSGEIESLLKVCAKDTSAAGVRDGALVAVWYMCGLRRAEVCTLDLASYDTSAGALIVKGKGNKKRMAYPSNGAADWLRDWLKVRGDSAGALFFPIRKGGEIERRRMTPQALYNTLAKRAEQAGVKDVSPHDLRRTYAGDLLDAGADISTVQKLMGHASVTTTQRYDRRDEKTKQKTSGLLNVPYWGRRLGK